MTSPTNTGLVSIIIPVYNRSRLIVEAVDSVLSQTYQNIEIIIVDDGSTDDTPKELERLKRLNKNKLTVITTANSGQVAARNVGVDNSSGEYLAFLDSDDRWLPMKLEKQLPLFQTQGIGLVYSGITVINDQGHPVTSEFCDKNYRGDIYHLLLRKNAMTGGTVIVSRQAIDKVGKFDEKLKAAENWDLWIRISECFKVDFIDEPLTEYRKHSGNMSKDRGLMIEALGAIIEKHCNPTSSDSQLTISHNLAHSNYHYQLGLLYSKELEFEKSKNEFLNVLRFDPNNIEAKRRLKRLSLGVPINRCIAYIRRIISS